MELPTFTLREFAIASLILHAPNGRLRSCEIGRAAGNVITRGGLQKMLHTMKKRGFVRKVAGELDGDGQRQTFVSLTRDGKAAATEFADFVSCLAQGIATAEKPVRRRLPGREATAEERALLLAEASAEFSPFLRAAWAITECSVRALGNVEVGDWDPRRGELQTKDGRVIVNNEARAVIVEAVGFRSSGPIFKPARAKRFTKIASAEFRDLCDRCGIAKDVRLRPDRIADSPAV